MNLNQILVPILTMATWWLSPLIELCADSQLLHNCRNSWQPHTIQFYQAWNIYFIQYKKSNFMQKHTLSWTPTCLRTCLGWALSLWKVFWWLSTIPGEQREWHSVGSQRVLSLRHSGWGSSVELHQFWPEIWKRKETVSYCCIRK